MRLPREIEIQQAASCRERIEQMLDERPMSARELHETLNISLKRVQNYLAFLSSRCRIVLHGRTGTARWYSTALFQKTFPHLRVPTLLDKMTTPTVSPVSHAAEWKPDVKEEIKDGVKITRYGAPPPRFAPDIKPGQGAISGDWVLRRQGVQIETRVRAYA